MSLTYSSYLKVAELLRLQQVQSDPPEHDETLFIVIHQVYELWFKQLIHEFEKIKRDFSDNDMYGAIAAFQRVRTIMKTLVAQLDILETMTPMSFLTFRDRLEAASGFQSVQFRELEFMLGHKRPAMLKYHEPGSEDHATLERRLAERSVPDHFHEFLSHRGAEVPKESFGGGSPGATQPTKAIQDALLNFYRTQPDVTMLLEAMTDFDEGMQEWRYRHVKMVERTIGNKQGTGGSLGVAFLKESLFKPVFPDLWAIRSKL